MIYCSHSVVTFLAATALQLLRPLSSFSNQWDASLPIDLEDKHGASDLVQEYAPKGITRSEERVQRARDSSLRGAGMFQSSPAPKSGCNDDHGDADSSWALVSILTRSEERVQRRHVELAGTVEQGFNPHPLRRAGATET